MRGLLLAATLQAAPAHADPVPPETAPTPAPTPPPPPAESESGTFGGLREAEYPAAFTGTETLAPAPLANNERRHDGFFFRAGLGVVRSSSGGTGYTGASPELLFGGTPGKGLVIGGGIVGVGGNKSGNFAYAGFAQYYPDPTEGFHAQAMAGVALLRSESAGPFVAGGIGMDGWVGTQTSLGVFGRLGYTLSDGNGQNSVFGSVAFTLTVH